MHCTHCGRETPPGHYCAHCGADLTERASARTRTRRHAFAANPSEHVYHPGIVSTFFPHFGPRRTQQMRWILLAGIIAIFLIGLGRIVPVATVASALFVPLLYLAYFYDVELYESEPLAVLGATFAAGALLGLGLSLIFAPILQRYLRPAFGPRPEYVLLHGIAYPILAQALMLVGPLLLYFLRPRFDEVLDGLAFGAASGLGFAAAQSIVLAWLLITGPIQQAGPASSWAIPAIRNSLFVPLLDAGTTGLICAALWAHRHGLRSAAGAARLGWLGALPVVIALALLLQMAPAVATDLARGLIESLIWYGLALLGALLLARHVLHVELLARARELGHGGVMRCPHCGHEAPDVSFCPHCGLAMRSTAKRARALWTEPAGGAEA